jgi:hypothetical protein
MNDWGSGLKGKLRGTTGVEFDLIMKECTRVVKTHT